MGLFLLLFKKTKQQQHDHEHKDNTLSERGAMIQTNTATRTQ
jgi:hypothetical protein